MLQGHAIVIFIKHLHGFKLHEHAIRVNI